MTEQGLPALGWDNEWASTFDALDDADLSPARVSRVDRGVCTVLTGTGERRVSAERGVEIAVGDWVALRPAPRDGGRQRVESILPRRCVFRRAGAGGHATQIVAANVDTVFICDAVDGRLGLRHLERFVALGWQSGAEPVVVITKSDAIEPADLAKAVEAVGRVAAGVNVVVVSSETPDGLRELLPYLVTGRTIALLGLSGAGKSTLVNLLAGAKILATGAVRTDGQGRHTTTHRQLVPLPSGGLLIDTPGMRALSVLGAGDGVAQVFDDLEALARDCAYTNCSHTSELGCAVAAALSAGRIDRGRVDGWLRLSEEPRAADHQAARGAVEERKRRKAIKVANRRAARA